MGSFDRAYPDDFYKPQRHSDPEAGHPRAGALLLSAAVTFPFLALSVVAIGAETASKAVKITGETASKAVKITAERAHRFGAGLLDKAVDIAPIKVDVNPMPERSSGPRGLGLMLGLGLGLGGGEWQAHGPKHIGTVQNRNLTPEQPISYQRNRS